MNPRLFLPLLLHLLALSAAALGDVTNNIPTSVTGGSGTVSAIQSADSTFYTAAKGNTVNIGGFASVGGEISSVVLHLRFSVASGGYTGTNPIRVNGVSTGIIPTNGDTLRTASIDITSGAFRINTWPEITALAVTFANNDTGAGQSVLFDHAYLVINHSTPVFAPPTWSDEFDDSGPPNPAFWTFEEGFVRNEELQWYQSNNAWQENGNLIIEGRREQMPNPNYNPGSSDWRVNRQYAEYTSSSIVTSGKYSFQYGRMQVRAKIPCYPGAWPAIWTLGDTGEWPSNGECDVLEYYAPDSVLANCAVGTATRWTAKWDVVKKPLSPFFTTTNPNPNWRNEYHIWTMQWDDQNVRLYIDNHLMNTTAQSWLVNATTQWGPAEPFKQPHFLLLNLALGGAGGSPAGTTFPLRYEIDHVRVWEGLTGNTTPTDIALSANSVAEGLPINTVVGNLTATDVDAAEVHGFSLVAGTGDTHNSSFEVVFNSDQTKTSVLRTKAVLSYAGGATRSIRVRVTDIEGATYDKIMTVNVAPSGYVVTYNGNSNTGGSVPMDSNSYLSGNNVTVLGNTGNLVRTGYTFVGWNTAANGSGTAYTAGNNFTISTNVTLYAAWTALPTYVVAYSANGATSGTVPADQIKVQGTNLTLATNSGNLVNPGYAFAGWNSAANGTGTAYAAGGTYSTDAAVTLHAQWTASGVLAVTPAGNLTSTGGYGGPFSPASLQYTISNTGTAPLDWSAGKTAAWLTLSSSSGSLAIGGNTTVTVSINSAANSLNAGAYSDTVDFINTTNGNGSTTRTASLTIGKAAQTINFAALTPALDNAVPFPLTATASSGIPVSYTSSNTNVATVSGSTVTVVGLGSTTISASQAGNGNFDPAVSVPQTLTVVRANPLAVISGPYMVLFNQSLSLNGSASQASHGETITSYSWDLNNDSTFGDVTGATPSPVSFADLTTTWGLVEGFNTIALRVTDSAGKTSTATTTVEIVVGLTWDANGSTANRTDGAGAWLTAGQWWDGTSNQSWSTGSSATFGNGGAGGAVTLASATSVNTLVFNSFTSTYTLGTAGNAITLNGGIVKNSASGAVNIISPIILGAAQDWTNHSINTLSITAGVNNNGNLLTFDGNGVTTFATIASSIITGSGGITLNGPGRLILGANPAPVHTYSGPTTINGGSLLISGNLGGGNLTINDGYLDFYFGGTFTRALGSGSGQVHIPGGTSGFSNNGSTGATVRLNNNATYEAVWGSASFNPSILVLQAANAQNSSTLTFDNRIDLNGADRTIFTSVTTGTGAGSATLAQIVRNSTGTAGLIKTGSGRLNLNAANTYNGGTTIQAGTLQLGNTGALGSTSGSLTINGGLLNLNDQTVSIGNLTGTGGAIANNASGTRVLTIGSGNGGGGIYQGVIANKTGAGTGTVAITKTGGGTITLANSNTYTGATLINGGTLIITGSTQATSSIAFANNSSLGLSIASPVTASGAAVDLSNGRIAVSGTPASASHLLLAAASITGSPVLANPIPGYELVVVGNQLLLNQTAPVDMTPPILLGITDNAGGTVTTGTPVTYTVTFSEDMNDATVTAADFANAGTSSGNIASVAEATPGVFIVQVTPTSAGILRLKIHAGAVLTDVAGNALNTATDIADDTLITVTPPNTAPVAVAQNISTAEDSALPITLAGTDAESNPLTYVIITPPANGALSGTAPDLTYTPAANYNGTDGFTFIVNDGSLDSAPASVDITVTPVNDTPVATAQNVSTAEDTALPITLAGTDLENSTLTYTIVTPPVNGTLSGTVPNVTFTPTANYTGADSFAFKVNDGTVDSAPATVSITITSVNDAPVFTIDPIIAAGATESIAYTGQTIAGSATDADAGDSITYSKVSGPAWLTIAPDGALSGTPTSGTTGLNSFVVRATDSTSATTDATLQITVTGLPLPWNSSDIGTGMLAGSTTHASGTFTQAGSGIIGGTADKLRFTYQTLTGDGEIIARISNLQNTGTSSRVGVMIRDTLATNSKQILMGLTSSGSYRWARRTATGGSTSITNSSSGTVPNTWVRLVRSGTTITAYKSSNGTTWTTVGSTTGTTFASTCYIGLAVSSGSDTTLNTSQFSNVSVTP